MSEPAPFDSFGTDYPSRSRSNGFKIITHSHSFSEELKDCDFNLLDTCESDSEENKIVEGKGCDFFGPSIIRGGPVEKKYSMKPPEHEKQEVKVIEKYFGTEEEEEVPEISIAPVAIRSLCSLQDEDPKDIHPDLKSLSEAPVMREFEATIGENTFNLSIVQKIKTLIDASDKDIMTFEIWDGTIRPPYEEKILNDIRRSRIRDSEFKDVLTTDMLRVIVFYCENDQVNY